jgi:tetratricopeptide (TPR) repeat protein
MPALPRMDQTLSDIRKLIEAQNFNSAEEADAFMQKLLKDGQGKVPHVAPTTPLEQAMEIIHEAEAEHSLKRRVALARKALEVSPDCAEAYNLLAESETDPRRRLKLFEQGVTAGERAIGTANFEEWKEMFWGVVETRPYMRALQGVAVLSWLLGDRARAIDIYRRMLALNPNDNQGVRYSLSNCLLEENTPQAREELSELFKQYPDDSLANWTYSRALLHFQEAGHATVKSDHALKKGLEANRHVPDFLLGKRRLPRESPAYMSPGDENEAVEYVSSASLAWEQTVGALEWLRLQSKS